jgi:hypothetical protein
MFTINGKKFAKNEAEFMDSLFEAGGTCVGFYKKTSKGVVLMNMQSEVIGFCKADAVFTGVVSASRDKETNKLRYMYGACSTLLSLLGFDTLTYSGREQAIKQALSTN